MNRRELDVALVTCAATPGLAVDEQALLPALAQHGLYAQPVVWDDPAFDWSRARLAVVRSTWDYHHRRDEFLAWAERAAAHTALWNPLPVLRWNTHKGYLRDLERRGVPIVPTVWLDAGQSFDLAGLLAARNWAQAVVKPAVSASAFATRLVTREASASGQAHLDALLAGRDVLIQPFLPSVLDYGERSLMFVDAEYTHAVRRAPALGAAEHGEEVPVIPAPEELALARAALRAAGHPTLYARADMVRDAQGTPRLMELELVEPSLFMAHAPAALERFARAIAARCVR